MPSGIHKNGILGQIDGNVNRIEMALEIRRLINSPVDSNCYVIFDKQVSKECVIVDPGSESNDMLVSEINTFQLKPRYIFLTHEHYDHCWGVNDIKERYPYSEIACSRVCAEAIRDPRRNYSHYCCSKEYAIHNVDIILDFVNWFIEWGDYRLTFVPAKGHSSSGVFMLLDNALFTGDTLIKNVKTITKYKTGSLSDLYKSIQYINSCKGKNYTVYPGHGVSFLLDSYDLSIAENGIANKYIQKRV